jgi:Ca2+-binding RTX toxin-like protein
MTFGDLVAIQDDMTAPLNASPGPTTGQGNVSGIMDNFQLSSLIGYTIVNASPTVLYLQKGEANFSVQGFGLTYDANDQITGGTVTRISGYGGSMVPGPNTPPFVFSFSFEGVSAAKFSQWVATNATQEALATVLAGNDRISGGAGAGLINDLLRGYGGDDILYGVGGADSLFGGAGDDQLYAIFPPGMFGGTGSGSSFLRGEDGDDTLVGGLSFDDMHGNAGDDVLRGGDGGDWVVGGKDQDLLYGENGDDIVYGNLGADTCDGGAGNDLMRGGQDNDSLNGGDGGDWISGDRGTDTLTGGAGADTFYTFVGAGLDRVTDFSRQQGDRIQLDANTAYTVTQVGADVLVDIGGGQGLLLVGVQQSSLTGDWLILT